MIEVAPEMHIDKWWHAKRLQEKTGMYYCIKVGRVLLLSAWFYIRNSDPVACKTL